MTPPAAAAKPEMSMAVRNPVANAVAPSALAPVRPDSNGNTATASSPPARATTLLTAEAMPACSAGAAPIAVAVSGATTMARPMPKSMIAGKTWVR